MLHMIGELARLLNAHTVIAIVHRLPGSYRRSQ